MALAATLFQVAAPVWADQGIGLSRDGNNGFEFPTGASLFPDEISPLVFQPPSGPDGPGSFDAWTREFIYLQLSDGHRTSYASDPWTLTPPANNHPSESPLIWTSTYGEEIQDQDLETLSTGKMFFRVWLLITTVEMVLLGVTATLPKSWTGWSSQFVKDGWGNFQDAYTDPPVWDTDHWFHNYIGHPYGGNVYYNTMRSQGGDQGHSFLFSMALSFQWEYLFEAVAEQPSIQDLLITPIIGSVLGEIVHNITAVMKKNGTSFPEKVFITILNPTSVFFNGYK